MERRLGRGLGALLGSQAELDVQKEATSAIPLGRIRPNPAQPRKTFDPVALEELAASLRQHGVLQPVVLRETSEGYELIAGERRWRAAQLAGLQELPALVRRGVSDAEMLELALVENVQRRDLDAIERAEGYREMIGRLGLTQEQVADRVGLQRATVANHLRLLELAPKVQEAVRAGLVSMGHARALLAFSDAGRQAACLARIVREGLSVRDVEALARREATTPSKAKRDVELRPRAAWARDVEARLQEALGTRIEVQAGPGDRGTITLHYFDRAGLDALLDRLAPRGRLG